MKHVQQHIRAKSTITAGFEPAQECPSGFRGHRLNHSARRGSHLVSYPLHSSSNYSHKMSADVATKSGFSSLHLDNRIVEILERETKNYGMGLKSPTKIQCTSLPLLLDGKNVLMKSETGSGKTLAYLLPMLHDLISLDPPLQRTEGTRALIIAPTRELCSQIADVLNRVTKCCVWIVGGSVTGGEKRKSEKARLRKGVSVLVATPGRLLDHLQTTESFSLQHLRWVILDEADRLLDMGFEQTVLEILSIIRGEPLPGLKEKNKDKSGNARNGAVQIGLESRWKSHVASLAKQCRQPSALYHVMVSATLTQAVRQLAIPVMGGSGFFVVDADRGKVDQIKHASDILTLFKDMGRIDGLSGGGMRDDTMTGDKKLRHTLADGEMLETPIQLNQYHMIVPCKWRLGALISFIRAHRDKKVVVFFSTCDSVDYHALLLNNTEWPTELDPTDYLTAETGHEEDAYKIAACHPSASAALEPLPSTFTGMPGKDCMLYRLHGSVPQRVRQSVYKDFCLAKKGVLLCTDVAARGLDLPMVDWILQYDPPCETADYVHRVGRTARRGLQGSALLFLLPSEVPYINLLSTHGLLPKPMSVQSLFLGAAKEIPGVSKFKNTDEMTAVILQRRLERVVHRNKPLLDAGRQAFRSFIRAYATHSADTKGIFKVQNLHLGHVAKSFALRESPKAIRNHDDVIGKIFNGEFTAERMDQLQQLRGGGGGGGEKDRKRKRHQSEEERTQVERRRLDSQWKKRRTGTEDREEDSHTAIRSNFRSSSASTSVQPSAVASSSSVGGHSQSERGAGAGEVVRRVAADPAQRKLRKIGKASVSGAFRKTTGYFRKKLRSQATDEFVS
eukprot:gene5730-11581_t